MFPPKDEKWGTRELVTITSIQYCPDQAVWQENGVNSVNIEKVKTKLS